MEKNICLFLVILILKPKTFFIYLPLDLMLKHIENFWQIDDLSYLKRNLAYNYILDSI